MLIEIYSKPGCVYCQKAINYLDSHGYQYEKYIIDVDITKEEIKQKIPLAQSLPIVVIDGVWIGGTDQLKFFLSEYVSK